MLLCFLVLISQITLNPWFHRPWACCVVGGVCSMGRAPFAARFQVRTEGGLDMIVMSTHIVFSGGEASRRTEVQKLCHIATTLPKVLPHVSDNTRQVVVGGECVFLRVAVAVCECFAFAFVCVCVYVYVCIVVLSPRWCCPPPCCDMWPPLRL